MSNKTETQNAEQYEGLTEQGGSSSQASAACKKPFVEPEISSPVDVLEATTYFQEVASEPTN